MTNRVKDKSNGKPASKPPAEQPEQSAPAPNLPQIVKKDEAEAASWNALDSMYADVSAAAQSGRQTLLDFAHGRLNAFRATHTLKPAENQK